MNNNNPPPPILIRMGIGRPLRKSAKNSETGFGRLHQIIGLVVVWSPTATINLGNFADNMRSFIDNNLSLMPSWSVATPTGNTSYRNMRYDMGVGNNIGEAGTGQYLYYAFSSIYSKISGHYNSNASPTWENQEYTGSGGLVMSPVATGVKVWTNSSLLDSFLVIDVNGSLLWGWFECQKWLIWGNEPGYAGTVNGMANTLPLGIAANYGGVGGYPFTNTYNSAPAWMVFDLDSQDSRNHSAASSNFNGKVIQGFRMMCANNSIFTSDKLDTVGIINSDQVLIQMGSTQGNMYGSNTLLKVTDGTNWWLRTNSNIDQSALMFPVGTSEPVFS